MIRPTLRRAAALLATALALPLTAPAANADHGNTYGHLWYGDRQVQVFDSTGDPAYSLPIDDAIYAWNLDWSPPAATNLRLYRKAGPVAPKNNCGQIEDNHAGKVRICSATYDYLRQRYGDKVQGVGFAGARDAWGHIGAASYILVCDDSCGHAGLWGPPEEWYWHRRTIVTHELGHAALGFGHSKDPGSIMYFSPPSPYLNANDVNELRSVYGHTN